MTVFRFGQLGAPSNFLAPLYELHLGGAAPPRALDRRGLSGRVSAGRNRWAERRDPRRFAHVTFERSLPA